MMSKYNKEQLKDMARKAIAARDAGDPRYHFMLQLLVRFAGRTWEEANKNIEDLAELETKDDN